MALDSFAPEVILRKRAGMRRSLLEQDNLTDVRIAVLSGSTANEVVDLLELLLLESGLRPAFFLSDYNRVFEQAVLDNRELREFKPSLVYVHTSAINVQAAPSVKLEGADFEASLQAEVARYQAIWDALQNEVGAVVIQNNFEPPAAHPLGNLDAWHLAGRAHFLNALNLEFARESRKRSKLLIQDLQSLAATVGLDAFLDPLRFHQYKILTTQRGSYAIARSLCAIIRGIFGMNRKCLVLDLDNTLWGGVIGDDGLEGIKLGRETPEAEAYTAFQEYCLELRNRGVLLAVCSKNDEANARLGLAHPDAVLKAEHFACIKANWEPKHTNIAEIAKELNLGPDSFVFVDDNPVERAIVSAQLPMVAVPDVGTNVLEFIPALERMRYFESPSLSKEDLERSAQYAENQQRAYEQARFSDYGEYLDSLAMTAEIAPFQPVYLERITQLTNKTNQFNLTTRRMTYAEIEHAASSPEYITLYGKLADKFGDNGLASVILGKCARLELHIELWLMSCRVLKREMEVAMLDTLTELARERGLNTLRGYYARTAKNGMVADHYEKLGFRRVSDSSDGDRSQWLLDVSGYQPRNRHIKIVSPTIVHPGVMA